MSNNTGRTRRERRVIKMWKIALIAGMGIIASFAIWLMKKIAPEDKIYPAWALLIVVLFALVVIFAG